MTQTTIIEVLRVAFPEPTPALRTYLQAYEALSHASVGTRTVALDANRAAWRALSEEEREAVDVALAAPLRVV